jgi:RHH-type proline utilization regulon transcriptional repressor/proline dehydrogenase/delta 1-pyrroline-5-carboxylate dehydrogenase
VCEAIDFLEYYALEAVALDDGRPLVQVPGERNTMAVRAARRGRGDLALELSRSPSPCGMTAAALAAGNAGGVEAGRAVAASAGALVDALHAAGVPRDALSLLPGYGEVGAALVRDPRVHVIAFTGSSAVGLEILRAAAETPRARAT